jgi:hypothetical protein
MSRSPPGIGRVTRAMVLSGCRSTRSWSPKRSVRSANVGEDMSASPSKVAAESVLERPLQSSRACVRFWPTADSRGRQLQGSAGHKQCAHGRSSDHGGQLVAPFARDIVHRSSRGRSLHRAGHFDSCAGRQPGWVGTASKDHDGSGRLAALNRSASTSNASKFSGMSIPSCSHASRNTRSRSASSTCGFDKASE